MKFIAALIATAAAVKDDEIQMDGGLDLQYSDLSAAAQAFADIQDFTVEDIAGLAGL